MAKNVSKVLTDLAVKNQKADAEKRLEVPDGRTPGLYLVVQPRDAKKKSWAYRYRMGGKPCKLTLGPVLILEPGQEDDPIPALGGALTLAGARQLARSATNDVARGIDPAAQKRAAREISQLKPDRNLFEKVVEQFLKRHVSGKRSAKEVERMLAVDVTPSWGKRSIQDITKRDVIELLDKITERGKQTMANRVFATIRKLFNWACERDIIKVSPCLGIKPPTVEKTRDRVLSDEELRCFWRACDDIKYPFGPLFKLLLLTGQRLSEVGDMTGSELKLPDKLWTIPRERAKNDNTHDVALSDAALDVLSSLKKIKGKKDYIFTTTGETPVSGFSRAKINLDAAMLALTEKQPEIWGDEPEIQPWRIHDLRRTVASGMARLGINLPVIEKVLNHQSGSFGGIVGVYQRHSFADEKRLALETWARFVMSLVQPQKNNVIEMRERGQ
jgi:integrase